ncbi:hypothetical protein HKX48_003658 [Thoreauomyces humboldtii]|nr:hypothetical protein HKX48_003658 [Thoreauomyces humboldtii]
MPIVHIPNHHFSGAYAKSVTSTAEQCDLDDDECDIAGLSPPGSPFRGSRSNYDIHSPDCKRVDSGYYSSSGGSVGAFRQTSAHHHTTPPASPKRTSSLAHFAGSRGGSPHASNGGTEGLLFTPYKMQMVSTPPAIEADATLGSASGAAGSVSQREFAASPLNPRFLAKYALRRDLGSGATGFVVAARRLTDHCPVAVKFLYKDRIPVTHLLRDRQLGGFVAPEVFILKRLDHMHIIKYLDFFEDEKFFYLITEHGEPPIPTHLGSNFCDLQEFPFQPPTPSPSAYGLNPVRLHNHLTPGLRRRPTSQDLFAHIDENPHMPEVTVRHIFSQLAGAVHHLHSRNIVHRDIKDENVLVSDPDTHLVKLIDFGLAAQVPAKESEYFTGMHGTPMCCAPEIVRGERYRGTEQDIWALGVVLFTMAFGQVPFRDLNAVARGAWEAPANFKTDRSAALVQVLRMCLCVDVKERATIAMLRESEWLGGHSDGSLESTGLSPNFTHRLTI